MKKTVRILCCLLAVLMLTTMCASAEVKYPSGGTLTIICTVAAGGNMDILARLAAEYLPQYLGCNVIVENIKGSGGVVAATQYLAERPNTDKIIFLPANIFTVSPLYNDLDYTFDDFMPIIAYNSEIQGVFVSAKGPIKTFDDLVNWDKSKTLLFGSGGIGVANYLMQYALYYDMGITCSTIPHSSAGEGVVNVLAGTTHVTLCSMSQGKQYVADGSLIPLFCFSDEDYVFEDGTVAPSLNSLGYPNYEIPSLQFFAIRSGSDAAIVEKLHDAFLEMYQDEAFLAAYAKATSGVLTSTSGQEIKERIDENIVIAQGMYEKTEE